MEETPQQESKNPIPDDLVNAFIEITSASHQEALFFLESHGFDLDSAVSTFLETNSLPAPIPDSLPSPRSRNRSPSNSPSQSYSPSSSPSRSRSRSPPPSVELDLPVVNSYNLRSGRSDKKKASSSRAPRIVRTISDLNRAASDDDDSDSDAPQEYYTGGEKSGMLVQDPSKKNNDVEALFNQVRQAGAEEGPTDHLQPSSSSRSFSGRARLLSGETVTSSSVPQEPVTHTITFWTNGFTIDDGPLRRLDDPENASFLESIRKSECPKELKPATKGAAVQVSLVRKFEDCPVPQKRHKPFHGIARTLVGSTSSTATEESAVPETSLNTAPTPSMGLVVDQTLPSTSIQLRLVDGTRMVSRFNLQHTISDIRSFIDALRPDGERAYQLQTMEFPPKQLTDRNQTIEQAGIANSVVIQKL